MSSSSTEATAALARLPVNEERSEDPAVPAPPLPSTKPRPPIPAVPPKPSISLASKPPIPRNLPRSPIPGHLSETGKTWSDSAIDRKDVPISPLSPSEQASDVNLKQRQFPLKPPTKPAELSAKTSSLSAGDLSPTAQTKKSFGTGGPSHFTTAAKPTAGGDTVTSPLNPNSTRPKSTIATSSNIPMVPDMPPDQISPPPIHPKKSSVATGIIRDVSVAGSEPLWDGSGNLISRSISNASAKDPSIYPYSPMVDYPISRTASAASAKERPRANASEHRPDSLRKDSKPETPITEKYGDILSKLNDKLGTNNSGNALSADNLHLVKTSGPSPLHENQGAEIESASTLNSDQGSSDKLKQSSATQRERGHQATESAASLADSLGAQSAASADAAYRRISAHSAHASPVIFSSQGNNLQNITSPKSPEKQNSKSRLTALMGILTGKKEGNESTESVETKTRKQTSPPRLVNLPNFSMSEQNLNTDRRKARSSVSGGSQNGSILSPVLSENDVGSAESSKGFSAFFRNRGSITSNSPLSPPHQETGGKKSMSAANSFMTVGRRLRNSNYDGNDVLSPPSESGSRFSDEIIEDFDESELFTGSMRTLHIHVSNDIPVIIARISNKTTVDDLIRAVLAQNPAVRDKFEPEWTVEDEDDDEEAPVRSPSVEFENTEEYIPNRRPLNWALCKIDRNSVATRIWLQADLTLDFYKVNDGDEFRLKYIKAPETMKLVIPPSREVQKVTLPFEATINDVLLLLSHQNKVDPNQKHGLYYPKLGFWLDEKRTWSSYEVEDDHHVEFRPIVKEFYLKVFIPYVDTKFTLKVIPSLQVADLFSLINYNIISRRLDLNESRRGCCDPFISPFAPEGFSQGHETVFALYHPVKKIWLEDDQFLDSYKLVSLDEIHYKIRYEPVNISLPQVLADMMQEDLLVKWPETNNTEEKEPISPMLTRCMQMLVTETTTVGDIVSELDKIHPLYKEEAALYTAKHACSGSVYGLYTRYNERLKDTDQMWNILGNLSPIEILDYRMIPRKIKVSTSLEPSVFLDMEVDLSKPLEYHNPLFLRRFGFSQKLVLKGCTMAEKSNFLDPKISLLKLGVVEGSKIMLMFEKSSQTEISDKTALNIWEEPPDNENNITYSNDDQFLIATGNLNKLVEKLTSAESGGESVHYPNFLKTFLLTYQSFTTPIVLMQKLNERYHVPIFQNELINMQEYDKLRLRIQLRVGNVYQQWTKAYIADFADTVISKQADTETAEEKQKRRLQAQQKHRLLIRVLKFAEEVLIMDHPALGRTIRKNVLKLRDGSFRKQLVKQMAAPPPPKINDNSWTGDGTKSIFVLEPEEIARQLTLLEFECFSKIMPYEFLNQAWTKADAEIRAPNILACTKRFNETALWVVKSILDVKSVRARAGRLIKLIEVAHHLYLLNNFATLMAFVAAFNKAAINRLKFTKKELASKYMKKLEDLEQLMAAEGAYKVYRACLHSVNPPCIPYLGVYLLDLTYIEDGNPNMINGLVNFSRRRLIHQLIREVQQYQDQPYNLKPVEDMVIWLNRAMRLPIQDKLMVAAPAGNSGNAPEKNWKTTKEYEDYLFELSLQREPRGAERSAIE